MMRKLMIALEKLCNVDGSKLTESCNPLWKKNDMKKINFHNLTTNISSLFLLIYHLKTYV